MEMVSRCSSSVSVQKPQMMSDEIAQSGMINKTVHKIINGDSRQMSEVNDKSVHLIVTSPPYWQLKDYGTENQIGFHDDYETYINHLNLTWREGCGQLLIS